MFDPVRYIQMLSQEELGAQAALLKFCTCVRHPEGSLFAKGDKGIRCSSTGELHEIESAVVLPCKRPHVYLVLSTSWLMSTSLIKEHVLPQKWLLIKSFLYKQPNAFMTTADISQATRKGKC